MDALPPRAAGPKSSPAVPFTGPERRAYARVPVGLWVEEEAAGATYFRRAANLGAGGLYFDRAIPHPLGQPLRLRFALPGGIAVQVTEGRVVGTLEGADGLGMRVQFLEVAGDGVGHLVAFCGGAHARR